MDKAQLQLYVEQGMSTRQIAKAVSKSQSTIRHWLAKHDLKTQKRLFNKSGRTIQAGKTKNFICKVHGDTLFSWSKFDNKYCCKKCWVKCSVSRKQKRKKYAIDKAGGKCIKCGYSKSVYALHFHHTNPLLKIKDISRMSILSKEKLDIELEKCELLCANCHSIEEGIISKEGYSQTPAAIRQRNNRTDKKQQLIDSKGGKCTHCEFQDNMNALVFHHIDPSTKKFQINKQSLNLSLTKLKAEADKCKLLCANCHAEEHERLDNLKTK